MIIEQLKNALEYLLSDFQSKYAFSTSVLKFLQDYNDVLTNNINWQEKDFEKYFKEAIKYLLEKDCNSFFEYRLLQILEKSKPNIDFSIKNHCQDYMSHLGIIAEAYNETLKTITCSPTMVSIKNPDDEALKSSLETIFSAIRKGDISNRAESLNEKFTSTDIYYLQKLMLAMKYRVGNCAEMTILFIYLLAKKGFYGEAEYVYFTTLDHAFAVINRLPNSDINDYRTWGEDCLIVDVWANEKYPAKELPQRLKGINRSTKELILFNFDRDKFSTRSQYACTFLRAYNRQFNIRLLEEIKTDLMEIMIRAEKIGRSYKKFLLEINIHFEAESYKQAKSILSDRLYELNKLKININKAIKEMAVDKKKLNVFVDTFLLKEKYNIKLIENYQNLIRITTISKEDLCFLNNIKDKLKEKNKNQYSYSHNKMPYSRF